MDILVKITVSPKLKAAPQYESDGAAAADLVACVDEPMEIKPGMTALVPTGISIAVPDGNVALVFARSGLSVKHGVSLANGVGVIDSDYRGEIMVALINRGALPYTVNFGDRIAQLAIMPVHRAVFETADALEDTVRGSGGFGSTGK